MFGSHSQKLNEIILAVVRGIGVLARIWMVSLGETFGKSADTSFDTKISFSFNCISWISSARWNPSEIE